MAGDQNGLSLEEVGQEGAAKREDLRRVLAHIHDLHSRLVDGDALSPADHDLIVCAKAGACPDPPPSGCALVDVTRL